MFHCSSEVSFQRVVDGNFIAVKSRSYREMTPEILFRDAVNKEGLTAFSGEIVCTIITKGVLVGWGPLEGALQRGVELSEITRIPTDFTDNVPHHNTTYVEGTSKVIENSQAVRDNTYLVKPK